MKAALASAELEENMGVRYVASVLERRGHQVEYQRQLLLLIVKNSYLYPQVVVLPMR